MDGSIVGTAFYMGIISACSLPLGATTALFWRPEDRIAAALVSFGGGALLAALTIDEEANIDFVPRSYSGQK